jgi:hypothetical protein
MICGELKRPTLNLASSSQFIDSMEIKVAKSREVGLPEM